MAGLKLYPSNSLENLALQFSQIIKNNPLPSPLVSEIIVTQSQGMKKWLSLKLAENLGIWANSRFFLPNTLLQEIFSLFLEESFTSSYFTREIMSWKMMDILPRCQRKEGFVEVKKYLADGDHLKLWQLSEQLANLFDQYLTYRPEMILNWENGQEKHWQAELWRILVQETEENHRVVLKEKLIKKLSQKKDLPGIDLPVRISLFGISVLPPFHFDILALISQFIEVNFFYFNPSPEFWAYIKSEKELLAIQKKQVGQKQSEDLYLEKGNSLLASMGKMGRDFFNLLMDYEWQEGPNSLFQAPQGESLLKKIQADIFQMIDRQDESLDDSSTFISNEDNSLLINSCHSPKREIDVLYDYLLDLWEKDPALKPRDILVMAPDISRYASFIDVKFSEPLSSGKGIPFNITGYYLRKETQSSDLLIKVLELAHSRFEISRVWEIFSNEIVYANFGLTEIDLPLLKKWLKEVKINWGLDAVERQKVSSADDGANSWEFGLDRLLLGYFIPSELGTMVKNIFPYDLEGGKINILGKFLRFFNMLKDFKSQLEKSYSLDTWHQIFKNILDNLFILNSETESDLQKIREIILQFKVYQQQANFSSPVDLRVIKNLLSKKIKEEVIKSDFFNGGVIFSSMLPMRSLPFKVICLLGMNQADFPRIDKRSNFNLILANPKKGDRSLRNEDRYFFLEALISAQQNLYLSYVGQNLYDNTEKPPSVLLSELLDYFEQGFWVPGKGVRDHLLAKHPLQSFSPKYFANKNSRFFSYSEEELTACQNSFKMIDNENIFLGKPLERPLERDMKFEDLIYFFFNPAKTFIRNNFEFSFDEEDDFFDDQEPFTFDGLERYLLEQDLGKRLLNKKLDLDDLWQEYQAKGLLPHGVIGKSTFKKIFINLEQVASKTEFFLAGEPLTPQNFLITLDNYQIRGALNNLWPGGQRLFRFANLKTKDLLRGWLYHLALNFVKPEGVPLETVIIAKDKIACFREVPENKVIIEQLVEVYQQGLKEPLPFAPETSWAWCQVKSREEAWRRVKNIWKLKNRKGEIIGEGGESHFSKCFSDKEDYFFNENFVKMATLIYQPLLKKIKLS